MEALGRQWAQLDGAGAAWPGEGGLAAALLPSPDDAPTLDVRGPAARLACADIALLMPHGVSMDAVCTLVMFADPVARVCRTGPA